MLFENNQQLQCCDFYSQTYEPIYVASYNFGFIFLEESEVEEIAQA